MISYPKVLYFKYQVGNWTESLTFAGFVPQTSFPALDGTLLKP